MQWEKRWNAVYPGKYQEVVLAEKETSVCSCTWAQPIPRDTGAGGEQGPAQHCASAPGNPQQWFSPSSCLFLWNRLSFAVGKAKLFWPSPRCKSRMFPPSFTAFFRFAFWISSNVNPGVFSLRQGGKAEQLHCFWWSSGFSPSIFCCAFLSLSSFPETDQSLVCIGRTGRGLGFPTTQR